MFIENVHEEPQPNVRSDEHDVVGSYNSGDVFLTWRDVCVTVPHEKGGSQTILKGATGYVEPGVVLAIMGPSGSGKSTLLDALAGRLSSNARQSGDILLNGGRQSLAFGTSAYVTQDDTLMTTLTVKEAVYYSAQLQLPDSMTLSEKKERAESTIREMGLQGSTNTRIGGWSSKGLSGGQKRRLSICIEILTQPKLLFLDEPTSGLDSAASYHVMSHIIRLARQDRRTVIAAIHQPSSEVFELFHNLCLLSCGKTVYFGSTSGATEFFAVNGFQCPLMRNPSDHFLHTINEDFDDADVEQGFGTKRNAMEAIETLTMSYMSSDTYQHTQLQIQDICQQDMASIKRRGSQAGFINQCIVLTRRSFLNMHRDLGYFWFRLATYTMLGLCLGTLFYHLGHNFTSIQARGSLFMFITCFLSLMATCGFPSFVEDMKIFRLERQNGHYGVAPFVVANTFSSIPYLFMIALVPAALAYYLGGLHKGLDHFAYFTFLLFVCLLVVESLMMVTASVVPNYLTGIVIGFALQGAMVLTGGILCLPSDLPKLFFKYPMFYVSLHKYVFQGFYKNEFLGLSFPNNHRGGADIITGEEAIESIWQIKMSYSKWVDVAILLGMVVLYRFMFFGVIKIREMVNPLLTSAKASSPSQTSPVDDDPSSTPFHS